MPRHTDLLGPTQSVVVAVWSRLQLSAGFQKVLERLELIF